MSYIAECVANGVQFLDEKIPDWRDRINLETLDMSSPYNCVCAQVAGSFLDFCDTFDLEYEKQIHLGFEIGEVARRMGMYDMLTDCWKKEIVGQKKEIYWSDLG